MWWRKRTPVAGDILEAQKIRAEAEQDMRHLRAQAPYVARLTSRLVERRELNHFGDEITVSFTPRGT